MKKKEMDFFDDNFDFSVDFSIDPDFTFETDLQTRYSKPIKVRELTDAQIMYEHAETLAKEVTLDKGSRRHCIVSGNFVFGDFIEAFVVENNLHIEKMIISTLSLSQNNIDSLKNLYEGDYLWELQMILSDYFYVHEKQALIPYLLQELDIDNRFQLAVAAVHTKICIFKTYDRRYYVMHGSANLRSSNCVEQFDLEENEDLYLFLEDFHARVIDKFKTINKAVRCSNLTQIINHQKQQKHGSVRIKRRNR